MSDDKPDPEEVADEVASALVGHLGDVVNTDGFVRAAIPDHRVEGVSELLRYRFLATGSWPGDDNGGDWEETDPTSRSRADAPVLDPEDEQSRGQPAATTADGTAVGVLDFLALLPARLRTLDPATGTRRRVQRGRADGPVDWPATRRHRTRSGGGKTEFVTQRQTSETLSERTQVLVWLLVRLRETAREALETFPISEDGDTETGETSDADDTTTEVPPWLRLWDEPEPGADGSTTTDGATGPRSVLAATLAENPHLDGVNPREVTVTDREVDTVTRDRDPLYAEAAVLAQKFRRLDGSLADAGREAVADLFKIEAFQPDPTESHEGATVFELYWALQLLDTFPSEYLSRFHMDGDEVLSRWTEGDSEYVFCHDTDGAVELAGTEQEIVDFVATRHWDETDLAEPETRRGYLRDHYLDLATATDLDRDYGEKEPDLLVFEFDADADDWVLRRLFIGEVKFSTKLGTVRSGLRELVEYAGFARLGPDAQRPDGGTDGAPVADSDFLGGRIELGLFVGRDQRVDGTDRDDMQAAGWGGSVERPLE